MGPLPLPQMLLLVVQRVDRSVVVFPQLLQGPVAFCRCEGFDGYMSWGVSGKMNQSFSGNFVYSFLIEQMLILVYIAFLHTMLIQ